MRGIGGDGGGPAQRNGHIGLLQGDRIVDAIAERMATVKAIGIAKAATGTAVRDPQREQIVFAQVRARAEELGIDPALVDLPAGQAALDSIRASGVGFDLFTEVAVEPTDSSFVWG